MIDHSTPVTAHGVTYPSTAALAQAMGVTVKTAKRARCYNLLDSIGQRHRGTQRKPIELCGIQFSSRANLAKVLGKSKDYPSIVLGQPGGRERLEEELQAAIRRLGRSGRCLRP